MQKILIINLKHFGDVLTTTPLLPALRGHFPGSRIYYLVRAGMEVMVEDHPEVEQVIILKPAGEGLLRRACHHYRFLAELRRQRFNMVFEFSRGDRGSLLAFASGAQVRVGYDPRGAGFIGRKWLFTHVVKSREEQEHTIEFHLDALRVLGIEPQSTSMSFHWSAAEQENADDLLGRAGLKRNEAYVSMHPTSRWMFKAWTPEGYAAVADHLQENRNLKVVLSTSPQAEEMRMARRICSLVKHPLIDLSGQLSLKQLGRVIQRAILFFGVDTAPMHMAVAVNTPVIVLFGPSGEHMWGPLGNQHRVITLPFDCRPCGVDGCNGSKRSRCLEEISAAEVIEHIEAQIQEMHLERSWHISPAP